ncbi:HNH endonuclease signature motif containing protein [Nocardioides sp. CER19]|uniref:HNH endonuclease signature motif containing protein n=1 Tax=Nocardioides sp. CER19 TaxID=3038538 RepID=UPI002449690B|nr:HNH endonuclease signature motif containing protein [Nocardioides sp. CER19]MDH2415071.1 DUF222 domain-containing protein [Nocardioides sp. CER19]
MTAVSDHPSPTPASDRRHEVHRFLGRLHERLDGVDAGRTWSLAPTELAECVAEAFAAQARIAALTLALVAQADQSDLASHDGVVDLMAWLRDRVLLAPADARRQITLARSLAEHPVTSAALAAGAFPVASAATIVAALDALPRDLDPAVREQAEEYLTGEAHAHDTRALRRLADHLDEVIDPSGAEARLAAQLARAEAAADRRTFVHLWHDELTATTTGTIRLPLLHGVKLQRMLESLLNPDRPDPIPTDDPTTGVRLSAEERRGHALAELIDRVPASGLPTMGGCDPSVVVTMDLTTLVGGLRAAQLATGHAVSPGLARRLAARSGVIPAVLGTDSEILDLGRKARFFSKKQRLAMVVQQGGTCAVDGCVRPAVWGEAHHLDQWQSGGSTDLADGVLICRRHHTFADHPDYRVARLRPGRIQVHRRC